MESILWAINLLCAVTAQVVTALAVWSSRKESVFKPLQMLFSTGLSLIMLPIFIWISGARLKLWIGLVLFVFGTVIGIIRGLTVKLYYRGDKVVGKSSTFTLLIWGSSLALAMLMNSFDSALLASLGLAPLCFSTGAQVSLNFVLLLRRLFLRSPAIQNA